MNSSLSWKLKRFKLNQRCCRRSGRRVECLFSEIPICWKRTIWPSLRSAKPNEYFVTSLLRKKSPKSTLRWNEKSHLYSFTQKIVAWPIRDSLKPSGLVWDGPRLRGSVVTSVSGSLVRLPTVDSFTTDVCSLLWFHLWRISSTSICYSSLSPNQ